MNRKPNDAPYCFPTIGRVELSAFDLYRRKPNVRVKIDRSVFCLIGANGLGKSTFLNSLLYGLTGGIPYRARSFSSPREYSEEATRLDRRDDYYGGRLSETVAEHAAITVQLVWPNKSASVKRQFFGAGAVTALEIKENGEKSSSSFEEAAAERAYKELVVAECGLPDFNQFVFLMHYVCAFDEDRHLLLWDPIALTNALYLAFGSDAAQAASANNLKRDVERLGSRARNSRFAARQSLDEAERLQKALLDDNNEERADESTLKRYERLNTRLDDAAERVHRKDVELRKAEAVVSDRSAALTELQLSYDETFADRAVGSPITRHHPLIRSTIRSNRCAVCATEGVADTLQSSIDKNVCPLCGSGVANAVDDDAALQKLKVLDQQIEKSRAALKSALDRRGRLKDDYVTSLQAEAAAREARDEFLTDNPNAQQLAVPETEPNALNAAIERLRAEADRFDLQSKKEYAERDRARRALHKIERELQTQFDLHSERFTELFRTYAEEFIGLTVDIELEHRKGKNETGFELLLSLEDQARSRSDDVSESQRFFLDIALRMALAEFMSSESATILIDTPEGSLDISYEARAGDMFSNFAKRGNSILMTANLRSSALLRRLARRQKRAGMQIERMTDWSELSEVQRQEEELFVLAYKEIEEALQ